MSRRADVLARALALCLSAGCVTAVAPAGAAGPEEPMQALSLSAWNDVLAAQQPAIAVADLWASWCVSCIERFPKMVEMSDRYRDRGVRFLTLNFDDPQDRSGIAWANGFLAGLDGAFAHYHLAENLTRSFQALDLMALPVVLIYDGEGRERFRLSNDDPNRQFSEADIEAAIEVLLAERGPE